MKKVCQVLFSTNRFPYLTRTLEAQKKMVDFEGIELFKLMIDDYPLNRDNGYVIEYAQKYGFNEIILHEENMGITSTWEQFFNYVKDKDFDYIFHHEDDVEPTKPIRILDMIEILENDKNLYQVQLKRNNWYLHENEEFSVKETDIKYKNFYYETQANFFNMLFAVYPAWIAKENFREDLGCCPSEGMISHLLNKKYGMQGAYLKDSDGMFLVNHFGETTRGKRVNEGEPGWEHFGSNVFDPSKLYNSRTGREVSTID